jgi:hypothetical protein
LSSCTTGRFSRRVQFHGVVLSKDLKVVWFEDVGRIHLAGERNWWEAHVNLVIKLRDS